jgi:hypothetical protein
MSQEIVTAQTIISSVSETPTGEIFLSRFLGGLGRVFEGEQPFIMKAFINIVVPEDGICIKTLADIPAIKTRLAKFAFVRVNSVEVKPSRNTTFDGDIHMALVPEGFEDLKLSLHSASTSISLTWSSKITIPDTDSHALPWPEQNVTNILVGPQFSGVYKPAIAFDATEANKDTRKAVTFNVAVYLHTTISGRNYMY